MDHFKKVNIDLLVPLLIVFAFLRLKKHYCFPLKLLRGLRFFVSNVLLSQKHLRVPQSASSIMDQSIIHTKLQDFNLSMMELDGSIRKGTILSDVPLYDTYEMLIYLSLSSVSIHFFSICFHCYSPISIYSIWGSLFVSLSVILPFRWLIRILLMTGFAAYESRIALVVWMIALTGSASLLFGSSDLLGLSLENTLSVTALHCNALLLQLSSTAIQPSEPVVVASIKLLFSLLTATTATGMVIPAMRFSQSFNTLIFGARYEKASVPMQALIIIDHFLPLFVAASMIPSRLILLSGKLSPRADALCLSVQLFATILMVAVRMSCMKRHIQCFLDAVVRTISVEIATNTSTDVKGIQVGDRKYG